MTSDQLALQIKRQPWDRALDVRIACSSAVGRQVVEAREIHGLNEMLLSEIRNQVVDRAKEEYNDEL